MCNSKGLVNPNIYSESFFTNEAKTALSGAFIILSLIMSRKMRKNNPKKYFSNLFLLNSVWNKKRWVYCLKDKGDWTIRHEVFVR